MGRLIVLLLLVVVLWPAPAQAQAPITGKRPQVIAGDFIVLTGVPVRLYGIDAPEIGQTCRVGLEPWNCGQDARWATLNRIGNNWVSCVERGRDPVGTLVAVCYLGGVGGPELNSWLVSRGWALAYRLESLDYVHQEEAARRAGQGLWRGSFTAPWIWRQGR